MTRSRLALLCAAALATATFAQAPARLADDELCYSFYKGEYVECVDLSGQDLSGQDLRGSDWIGANLEGTVLVGCSLEHSFMSEASLVGADLRGANVYAGKFYRSDLSEADLRGTDLRGSWLVGADMESALVDDDTLFNGSAYSSETKLPAAFGPYPTVEASRRGMLPIRE
jgi:uncharacterized protein YjbI with pentapeptide repeats